MQGVRGVLSAFGMRFTEHVEDNAGHQKYQAVYLCEVCSTPIASTNGHGRLTFRVTGGKKQSEAVAICRPSGRDR